MTDHRFVKFTTMPHSGTFWMHAVTVSIDGRAVGHLEMSPSELATWRALWSSVHHAPEDDS